MEPWLVELARGDSQRAWDLFLGRYRPLIVATIRRLLSDHDDAMDVFAEVCATLSANGCARLTRYSAGDRRGATVATWLVVVVRHLTIDWLRHRDGRRATVPATLSPLHGAIYQAICIEANSVAAAYEIVRARLGSAMPFGDFLREVRAVQRVAPCTPSPSADQPLDAVAPDELTVRPDDPAERDEAWRRLSQALDGLPADVRLALDLFVVDGLPARDVARIVGWPDAKAVYNRVYRALAVVREVLARQRVGPGDL